MKIFYIHGFASRFDPEAGKVMTLSQIGSVSGGNYDYTRPFPAVFKQMQDDIIGAAVDLIVGTSLGGYYAAAVGASCGIPFVSINPAIRPRDTLIKYLGTGTTWTGDEYYLSESVVREYPPFVVKGGCGLVLLDMGDDVLDARETLKILDGVYEISTFEGGSHRFDHMAESLDLIKHFLANAEMVYGFGDFS